MVLEETQLLITVHFARLWLCGLKCYAPDICCRLNVSSQFETKCFRRFCVQGRGKIHYFAQVKQAVPWTARLRKCGLTSTCSLWLLTWTPCNPPTFVYCFLFCPTRETTKHSMVCPEPCAYRQTRHDEVWHVLPIIKTLKCISILYSAIKFHRNLFLLEIFPFLSKLVCN